MNLEDLFDAIEMNSYVLVQRVLSEAPELAGARGKSSRWPQDSTPLQVAAEFGRVDLAELLLGAGAPVNDAAGLTGWTPLHLSLKNQAMADLLRGHGAEVDVFAAAGLGDLDRLRSLLDQEPGLVKAEGPDGATALHFAKTIDIARLLLERGADLEALDQEHGATPLRWLESNRPVARFLLDQGALVPDIFLATGLGLEDIAARMLDADPALVGAGTPAASTYGEGATPLHIAAWNGHAALTRLLLDRGAAVSARGGSFAVTPLHWAAQHNHLAVARLLLAAGADLTVEDTEFSATPAGWAFYFGHEELGRVIQAAL